ncbi:MAG: TetR family transcriptional regulator [Bacillota bacterium]
MKKDQGQKAKKRITAAAIDLFSQKGYDATSVNEIAGMAGVTKALIYYYFKSKEDILDNLVSSLLEDTTAIAMDFIHENIVRMITEGLLDIEPGKLHFNNDEARKEFMNNVYAYHEQFLDYALANRATLRILMLESLKKSKHHNALLRY